MNRSDRRAQLRAGTVPALVAVFAIAVSGCLSGSVRPTPVPTPTPIPTPTPQPTPSPTPGPPTPTPAPTFRLYSVKAGDTLIRIARRFHTSTRSLSYWNRATYRTLDPESAHYRPDRLEVGWVLQLMPNKEYVAPPDDGETGIQVTPTPDGEQLDATEAPSGSPAASPAP